MYVQYRVKLSASFSTIVVLGDVFPEDEGVE